jgi:hypothetical protein
LAKLEGGSVVRKVLIILLVVVVAVVGLGFYREWFSFAKTADAETGKTGVEFRIDRDKMKSDVQKARQRISGTPSQAKEQSGGN